MPARKRSGPPERLLHASKPNRLNSAKEEALSLLAGSDAVGSRTVRRNRPAKLVCPKVRGFSRIVIVHVGQADARIHRFAACLEPEIQIAGEIYCLRLIGIRRSKV